MKIINHEEIEKMHMQNCCIAIGNFDGVHIGHRKIIDKMLSLKCNNTILYSFSVHTASYISDTIIPLITEENEKVAILSELNIDFYATDDFTIVSKMTPEQFIAYLKDHFSPEYIVVGDDFKFGCKKTGDIYTLMKYQEECGYKLFAINHKKIGGQNVSSTRIRKYILNGSIEKANILLGHEYMLSGEVVYGKQLGRKLGFPTANVLIPANKVIPPNGVYATKTIIDGKTYDSVTNVGRAPTVNKSNLIISETNIFNFNEDIYGKNIIVLFERMIRSEKKFESLKLLTEQIRADVKQRTEKKK